MDNELHAIQNSRSHVVAVVGHHHRSNVSEMLRVLDGMSIDASSVPEYRKYILNTMAGDLAVVIAEQLRDSRAEIDRLNNMYEAESIMADDCERTLRLRAEKAETQNKELREAGKIVQLIKELSQGEGDAVEVCHPNPDEGQANTIIVSRSFDAGTQYFGESILDCLNQAFSELQKG